MITLKLNTYSLEEIVALGRRLYDAKKTVINRNCKEDCKTCALRHLCYDLTKAEEYCNSLLEEMINNDPF